jgi:hypothetical protein
MNTLVELSVDKAIHILLLSVDKISATAKALVYYKSMKTPHKFLGSTFSEALGKISHLYWP